jgi:hypothetical protein
MQQWLPNKRCPICKANAILGFVGLGVALGFMKMG